MNGQVKVGNGSTDQKNVVRYDFRDSIQSIMVAKETKYDTNQD